MPVLRKADADSDDQISTITLGELITALEAHQAAFGPNMAVVIRDADSDGPMAIGELPKYSAANEWIEVFGAGYGQQLFDEN